MKVKIILFTICVAVFASCTEPHDACTDEPEVRSSVHYFYVENKFDEDIRLEFNSIFYDNYELSEDYEINTYYKVMATRNDTTLVRVFDNVHYKNTSEALNCFYYPIMISSEPRHICTFEYSGYRSPSVWNGEYWRFKRLNKYEASYTLVIDEDLVKKLFS